MCMFLQMCICVYVSVYTCMCVFICVYVYMCMYMCICVCVYMCVLCGCVCLHVRLSLGLSYSSWYRITQCYSLLFILFLAFLFPSYFLPNILPF